jgi:hypothetical protein
MSPTVAASNAELAVNSSDCHKRNCHGCLWRHPPEALRNPTCRNMFNHGSCTECDNGTCKFSPDPHELLDALEKKAEAFPNLTLFHFKRRMKIQDVNNIVRKRVESAFTRSSTTPPPRLAITVPTVPTVHLPPLPPAPPPPSPPLTTSHDSDRRLWSDQSDEEVWDQPEEEDEEDADAIGAPIAVADIVAPIAVADITETTDDDDPPVTVGPDYLLADIVAPIAGAAMPPAHLPSSPPPLPPDYFLHAQQQMQQMQQVQQMQQMQQMQMCQMQMVHELAMRVDHMSTQVDSLTEQLNNNSD